MVNHTKSMQQIGCSAPFLLALALGACGKPALTKAEEKAAAERNITSNVIVGEQVKAMEKAKAVEAEMNKAVTKAVDAADAIVK